MLFEVLAINTHGVSRISCFVNGVEKLVRVNLTEQVGEGSYLG